MNELLKELTDFLGYDKSKDRILRSMICPVTFKYGDQFCQVSDITGEIKQVDSVDIDNIGIELSEEDFSELRSINFQMISAEVILSSFESFMSENKDLENFDLIKSAFDETKWYLNSLSPWTPYRVSYVLNIFRKLRDSNPHERVKEFIDSALERIYDNTGDVSSRHYYWFVKFIYTESASHLYGIDILNTPIVRSLSKRESSFYLDFYDRDVSIKEEAKGLKREVTPSDIIITEKTLSFHYGYEDNYGKTNIGKEYRGRVERSYRIDAENTLVFMDIVSDLIDSYKKPWKIPYAWTVGLIAFMKWRDRVSKPYA